MDVSSGTSSHGSTATTAPLCWGSGSGPAPRGGAVRRLTSTWPFLPPCCNLGMPGPNWLGHRASLATSWGQRPLGDPGEGGGRLLREARPARQGGEGCLEPTVSAAVEGPSEVRCLQGAAPREVLCFKLLVNGQRVFSCEL